MPGDKIAPMVLRGALRALVVLLAAVVVLRVLGWCEPRDVLTAARPALLIAVVPITWGRSDCIRLGAPAAERVWTVAAGFAALGFAVLAARQSAGAIGTVLVALGVGATVAVPAWATITNTPEPGPSSQNSRSVVPRAARALMAGGGATALLTLPIVVTGWQTTIEWSGCFLDCREPDRVAAVLWAAGAGVLCLDIIAWAATGWLGFPRRLTTVATVPIVACAVAAFLVV